MTSTSLESEIEDLSREILERYEEVNILYRLSDSFRDVFDEQEILERLLSESARSVHASAGWISVLTPDGRLKPPVTLSRGRPSRETDAMALAARSIAEDRALTIDGDEDPQMPRPALLCVPLRGKSAPIGALVLEKPARSRGFHAGDMSLAAAVASVGSGVVENRRLVLDMKRTERVRGEIEIARRIQQGLLPGEDPVVRGLTVSGLCRPAQDIGGDYFGYSHVAPGRFGITIADVSGHSIGAAIGMVMARCLIQSEAHQSSSPARIASRVNELLNRDLTDPGMFVTAFLAVYEEKTGRLAYTNAGHNPPLLLHGPSGKVTPLRSGSLGLGILPGTKYADRHCTLRPGDMLLLYTDGLTEARCPKGEMFGVERLSATLRSCRSLGARQAVDAIVETVSRWRDASDFVDDLTLVVARKEAPPASAKCPPERERTSGSSR
jgi:sigma-B regulation protein RsbU (phosphoserine phosphatase)